MKERIYEGCDRVYQVKKFNNLKELINNTQVEYGENSAFKFKNKETKELYTMSYNETGVFI